MKNKILTLDYHGVVDKDYDFFISMGKAWQDSGGVVILLSGLNLDGLLGVSDKIYSESNFRFNQCISVETRLLNFGVPYTKTKSSSLWFSDYDWNSAKGVVCEEIGSDLHFDDSPEYQEYFTTPFVLWK
jgi:hypothetical protein